MKIYTKTGDTGETSLYKGQRVLKSSLRIHVIGEIDELNSLLGVILCFGKDDHSEKLIEIQQNLFVLGAQIASKEENPKTTIAPKDIETLETWIDSSQEKLPELKKFILPSGGKKGAFTHLARTVCRRAERNLQALCLEETIEAEALRYLNRLSDYLFVLARCFNLEQGKEETLWLP